VIPARYVASFFDFTVVRDILYVVHENFLSRGEDLRAARQ
jgi:hypothetical protein